MSTRTDDRPGFLELGSPAGENPVSVGATIAGVALTASLAVVGVLVLSRAGVHLGWVAVLAGTALLGLALLLLLVPRGRGRRRGTPRRPSQGPRERLVLAPLLVIALSVLVGVVTALTPLLTLPVLGTFALVVAVVVVLLFSHHFPTGLLVLFVIRPSLDEFKVGTEGSTWADPSVLSGVVFLAAAGLWLLRRRAAGTPLLLSRSSAAFAALGLVCVLSSVTAAQPFDSLQASVRVLASAVMLVVLEATFRDSPNRLRPLLVAVFASLVVPAGFAALQLVGSAPVQPLYGPAIDVGRIRGTFVHPNAFATYLVVLIPLGLALYRHVRGAARVALVGCTALSAVLLLFTYARAAWIAALVGVLIVGWLQDRRIIAAVLAGVLVLAVAVPSVSTRLGELGQGRDERTDDPNSLVWRVEYWGRILPSMGESPVTGIGLGMVEAEQVEQLPPHNVYVQAAAETGVAGLLALVLLVVALVTDLRAALARATGGMHRAVLVGAVAAAAGFLVQTFSENLLNQPVSHWYLLLPVAWATVHSGRRPWVVGRSDRGPATTAPVSRPEAMATGAPGG